MQSLCFFKAVCSKVLQISHPENRDEILTMRENFLHHFNLFYYWRRGAEGRGENLLPN